MADSAFSPKTPRTRPACKHARTHARTLESWMCLSKASRSTSRHVGSCCLQECAHPPAPLSVLQLQVLLPGGALPHLERSQPPAARAGAASGHRPRRGHARPSPGARRLLHPGKEVSVHAVPSRDADKPPTGGMLVEMVGL